MRTVWKATIVPNSYQGQPYPIVVEAKKDAKPLAVMKQGLSTCLWFEVETTAPLAELTIWCVGTGFGSPPDGTEHFASVVDGDYVWHFYRKGA